MLYCSICDKAVCDHEDDDSSDEERCSRLCSNCKAVLCVGCVTFCEDPEYGIGGCGEPICQKHLVKTPCEIQMCGDCMDEYECPDCDTCHSIYR